MFSYQGRGSGGAMAPTPEQVVSMSLRAIIADLAKGSTITESGLAQDLLLGLQWFIPIIICEIHPEFSDSLDGIQLTVARKTGENEAELFGLCCFISDQALAPLHLRIRLVAFEDKISWFECRFGEREGGRMRRAPYRMLKAEQRRLQLLDAAADQIDWVYRVTFGERRP